jgi:hypothetical protein
MWRRLSVLALCGIPALWADVCGGLPAAPSKGLEFWPDVANDPPAVSFELSVKRGLPAFRITVRPVSFDSWLGNGVDDKNPPWFHNGVIHAGDIEVARCQDGKQVQVLPIMAWQPINFGPTFHANDINFDGYLDFSVLTDIAAGWVSRSYWVYDPGSGHFVQNELTQTLEEEYPTGWKGRMIEFDSKKREISTFEGYWNCQTEEDRYRVQNNRPILVHKEVGTQGPPREPELPYCIVTVSDLTGGTMRVSSVHRFDAQGRPVK